MTIRWHFSDSPLVSVLALEIDDVHYTREEVERIVAAHSSGDTCTLCVRGAHRVLGAFCEVPDCGEKRAGTARYCKKHQMRFKRHGDPVVTLRPWDKKKEKVV